MCFEKAEMCVVIFSLTQVKYLVFIFEKGERSLNNIFVTTLAKLFSNSNNLPVQISHFQLNKIKTIRLH